jgi:hypothetical protein
VGKTVLKDGLPMAQTLFGENEFPPQVSQIPTTEIFEFPTFEQVPHPFLW